MKRLALVTLLILILAAPAAVQAVDPTPAPAAQDSQARSGSPLLGILVLTAPFVFMIWKSRGKKTTPRVTSGACLPVMGQDRSPETRADQES